MKIEIVTNFLIAAIVLFSCKKHSDNCSHEDVTAISNVVGPTTASLNQDANFIVDYLLNNECDKSYSFEEEINSSERIVRLKVKYEGCDCAETPILSHGNYTFRSNFAGTNIIKFVGESGNYLLLNVVVQ